MTGRPGGFVMLLVAAVAAANPADLAAADEGPPVKVDLRAESGVSGLGHPFPTAIADPLQAVVSSLAYPSMSDGELFRIERGESDRIFTIHIEAAYWGDRRTPVRAGDLAASLESLISRETGSPFAVLFRHVLGFDAFRTGEAARLDGLCVLDAGRLQLLLREPDPDFAERLAHPAAGLVLWTRENPQRPSGGPDAWVPGFGRPVPLGLKEVVWDTSVGAAGTLLPAHLELPGPEGLGVTLRPTEQGLPEAGAARVRLTGPDLPGYCGESGPAGDDHVVARGRSLILLLMRPAAEGGGERRAQGLPPTQRLSLALRLASESDLFPHAEGFSRVDGFLDNPPGHLEDLLLRAAAKAAGEPGDATDGGTRYLFFPSGDPLLQCLAKRIEVVAATELDLQAVAIPRGILARQLRQGDFDLQLVAFPSLASTPWENAAITLGFLASYLGDGAELTRLADWTALPVDASRAEAQARRLEAELIGSGLVLPLGWMTTRLTAPADRAGDLDVLDAARVFSLLDGPAPPRRAAR